MRSLLAALFLLLATPCFAQQNCPFTPAVGTSNTTCANTAFVTSSVAAALGTISPGQILANYTTLTAKPLGNNWLASANACPTWLTPYQFFGNTTSSPTGTVINIWDNAQCVPWMTLNESTHTWVLNWSGDAFIGRNAAASLRLGQADAASPVAQILGVQSVVAGTANTAGANLIINGSQSTGSAAGGSICFQTAPAGGAGSAQNALAQVFCAVSTGATFAKAATFNAAANFSSTTLFTGAPSSITTNGQASVGVSATLGGILIGKGSTNDLTLENSAGTTVCSVATGTTILTCSGIVSSASAINSQAAGYSIQSSDCGKVVVETGSFQSISLPVPSGFASNCLITVYNASKTRAQVLSGFPGPVFFCNTGCLWPQQTITVWNNAGTWQWMSTVPSRYFPDLTAQSVSTPTLYVGAAACSNNFDGLVAGSPLCSINTAIAILQSQFEARQHNPHVTLSTGTFVENVFFAGQGDFLTDGISIAGTGASTIITSTSGSTVAVRDFGVLFVNDTVIECATGGAAAEASQFATLDIGAGGATTILSDCPSGIWFQASNGGHVNGGPITFNVSASANSPALAFFATGAGASISLGSNVYTCDVASAVLTVANFAEASILAMLDAGGATFSGCGTVTGTRYIAASNAVITGTGAVANFFPGNVAGSTLSGGIYQ